MPMSSLYNNILTLNSVNEKERNTKLRWLKEAFEAAPRREQDALIEGMARHLLDNKPPVTKELAAGFGYWVGMLSPLQMATCMHAFATGAGRGEATFCNGVRPSVEDEKYISVLQQRLHLNRMYAQAIRDLTALLDRVVNADPSATEDDREAARMLGRTPG